MDGRDRVQESRRDATAQRRGDLSPDAAAVQPVSPAIPGTLTFKLAEGLRSETRRIPCARRAARGGVPDRLRRARTRPPPGCGSGPASARLLKPQRCCSRLGQVHTESGHESQRHDARGAASPVTTRAPYDDLSEVAREQLKIPLRVTCTGSLSHWKGLAYANVAGAVTRTTFLARRGITHRPTPSVRGRERAAGMIEPMTSIGAARGRSHDLSCCPSFPPTSSRAPAAMISPLIRPCDPGTPHHLATH